MNMAHDDGMAINRTILVIIEEMFVPEHAACSQDELHRICYYVMYKEN